MKQLFEKAFRLILWDWSTILIFELLYKFFLVLVAPYYELLLEQALKVAGLNYLTVQNMTQLFTHPVAIVYLLLLFLLFLLYVYVEITAIIIYCQHGISRSKIGPLKLMAQAVRKAVIIMWPRNVLLMLFVAVIIPLTGFSLSAGPLIIVKVPGFILDYIHGKTFLNIFYKGIIFFC
ncbi:glycerophosphoryl diester phosphodiesterase membrane domain-containing protein [Bacillus massiliigorillae]|uniref:glycerophosphoryl diester phosphodiesterase membrane domain-containing protein n=1 Tax=Bacillus massiliigorillae TaxID=1243664 RepID=UPI0003A22B9B|nr:glycerophosphoryl diester phosphodiesterase membrane domain-containing protein [Bacillus massiliigorillae]